MNQNDFPPAPVKQQTILPAAGKAIRDPVETAFERLRIQASPVNVAMKFVDVVSAVGNVPGSSNRLRTKGPTLLSVDGLVQNPNTDPDVGGIKLWMSVGNGPQSELYSCRKVGPYFYLPQAGEYFLRGGILVNPLTGAITSISAYFNCTLYEGIDVLLANALLSFNRPSAVHAKGQSIPGATTTAIIPPAAAASWDAPTFQLVPFGNAGHAIGVTLTNTGVANPVSIQVNTNSATPLLGIILAAGQSVRIPLGGINTLYAYSVAGTTITGTWEYD